MTTGQKIKSLRKSLGMTQEELGKEIGVGKAAINKYETGIVVNLKRSTLSSLAKALHVTLSDLLDDEPEDISFLNDDISKHSPFEPELLEKYRKLNPVNQALVISHVELLLTLEEKKRKMLEEKELLNSNHERS